MKLDKGSYDDCLNSTERKLDEKIIRKCNGPFINAYIHDLNFVRENR